MPRSADDQYYAPSTASLDNRSNDNASKSTFPSLPPRLEDAGSVDHLPKSGKQAGPSPAGPAPTGVQPPAPSIPEDAIAYLQEEEEHDEAW